MTIFVLRTNMVDIINTLFEPLKPSINGPHENQLSHWGISQIAT